MGKGEIACYEQFLLFPQCFQKACFPGASKGVIVWEWVKKLVEFEGNTTSGWLNPIDTVLLSKYEVRPRMLTFSQTTKFRLIQIERVCRQLFKIS